MSILYYLDKEKKTTIKSKELYPEDIMNRYGYKKVGRVKFYFFCARVVFGKVIKFLKKVIK